MRCVGGSSWRNSISSSLSCERACSRNWGGARPSSSGCSSRSALPRTQTTRSPRPRSRASVSDGCSPPAQTSPPTTIVASSGTSARTASSAARLPWMSYMAATDATSVGDLELEPPACLHPARANDRAQCPREPALPADHLADVCLGHVQPQHERAVVVLDLLDAHGAWLVDEPAGELGKQLRHGVTRCRWP